MTKREHGPIVAVNLDSDSDPIEIISATGPMMVLPYWVFERVKTNLNAMNVYCLLQIGPTEVLEDAYGGQIGLRALPTEPGELARTIGVDSEAIIGALAYLIRIGAVTEADSVHYPNYDDPGIMRRLRETEFEAQRVS